MLLRTLYVKGSATKGAGTKMQGKIKKAPLPYIGGGDTGEPMYREPYKIWYYSDRSLEDGCYITIEVQYYSLTYMLTCKVRGCGIKGTS